MFLPNKSTNVRSFMKRESPIGWLDGLAALARPWSAVAEAARLYFTPERAVAPPALPEPAGGVVLAVPGFTPHLNARLWPAAGAGGPLVLLAHDWEGQVQDVMPLVAALLSRGAGVLAFDAPAHGRSSGDSTHLVEMAAAVRAVVRAVGAPVHAAIGHGVGATALTLALEGDWPGTPPVRLVLLAPLADPMLPVRQIAHIHRLDMNGEMELVQRIDRVMGQPIAALVPKAPPVAGLLVHSSDDRIMPVADALHIVAGAASWRTHLVSGLGHRRLIGDVSVVALAADHAVGRDG